MKKLFALMLILCLCLPMAVLADSVPPADVVYHFDCSNGMDGWYARGEKAMVTMIQDGLCIIDRNASWNSPSHDFDLTPGTTYWFQVSVLQKHVDEVNFILSIAHTRDGVETYENLGRVSAEKGDWATLIGSWTADEYDKYTLYVETEGEPSLIFTIRDFRILLSEPDAPAPQVHLSDMPSLKELYADKFDVGTCVSQADVRDPKRTALVLKEYSIITPENELKPDAVLDVGASRKLAQEDDTAVAVHFNSAEPILNFARDNGLKVHGHVLVWHSQTPEAFFHVGYDTNKPLVSREVMLARLDNYIRLVMEYMDEHYPGLIVSWDVVNEAVADGSKALRASNWTKVVGQDFLSRAFEIADKYAPEDVLLCYNDYSTPYEPKTTGIVNLLTTLAAEGHIDGYGFQTHYQSGQPSVSVVKSALDRVQALGLKLRVSEMDIAVSKDTDASREAQAKYYADLMQLYLDRADVMEAVQVWGICDGTSWIKEKYPLIFDKTLQPKPAFWALVELMEQK